MRDYPDDIYTEPSDVDPHTLKNLGPLTNMAGVWEGVRGLDVNPKPDGPERQVFVELVATRGAQTNGICSNPFLERAFKFEPFHHTDRNTLTKIAEPTPNPLARG